MNILRVQTSARTIQVRLYTRGRAPACWHYYFSFRGRHRGSTHQTALPAAQAAARQTVQDVVDAVQRPHVLPLGSTVEEYLKDRWPAHYRIPGQKLPPPADDPIEQGRYHTAKDHRGRLRTFAASVDAQRLLSTLSGDALTDMMHRYLHDRLTSGKNVRTVRNDQLALSAFCAWLLATHREQIPWRTNPASRHLLRLPKLPQHDPALPSEESLSAFLAATRPTPLWPVIVLILGADFRPSGALRVQWRDVNFTTRKVRSWEKNSQRERPLPSWAYEELSAWRRTHPDDVEVWPYGAAAAFNRVTRIPGHVTLQQLRRVASNRLIDGVDLRTYSAIAGHSLAVAQAHYLKRKATQASQALDAAMDFSALSKPTAQWNPPRRKAANHSSTKSSTRHAAPKKARA